MTFRQAYRYAMDHSEYFRDRDQIIRDRAQEAAESPDKCGEPTNCIQFSTAPGEVFYYGFDGVDVHKGKHTAKRAAYLLKRGGVLVIR